MKKSPKLVTHSGGQIPLRGVSRRRTAFVELRSEAELQAAIVDSLKLSGMTVLVTSRVRKRVRCEKCETWQWPAGGDGVTKGMPDLWVRREWTTDKGVAWPEGTWLGLEVKPYKGARIRPEQKNLADAMSIFIVYSVQDAVDRVKEKDTLYGDHVKERSVD